MKMKGFIVTLLTVTIACFQGSKALATAPTICNPGDIIIGDLEGPGTDNFVFPDAINLLTLLSDAESTPGQLLSGYMGSGKYVLNGAPALVGGEEVLIPPAKQLNAVDTDPDQVDGDPYTVTFRNNDLAPPGGPNIDPGASGLVASQTQTITLIASDGTTFTGRSVVVYTSNNTSDSVSGGCLTTILDLDFENDPNAISGWYGAVIAGGGSTATAIGTALRGLCMSVPALGNNNVGWTYAIVGGGVGSGALIDLVDNAIYRCRTYVSTGITTGGQTPLFDFTYANTYVDPGAGFAFIGGGNYGGEHIILDNEGGAGFGSNAPGTTRPFLDLWISPAAMLTQQWKTGAFVGAADAENDMFLTYRLLDFDAAGVNAQVDQGDVCVRRLIVARADLATFTAATVYNPAISTTTHSPFLCTEVTNPGGCTGVPVGATAAINNTTKEANYVLLASGLGGRFNLIPFDQTLPPPVTINRQVYPVQWQANSLYLTRARIRSNVNGGAGTTEGTEPLDYVGVVGYVPTSEVLSVHLVLRGSTGQPLLEDGSPKLPANTGGNGQEYVGLWYSHNVTLSGIPDANRWQPRVDLFNTTLFGTGADPVTVQSLEIDQLTGNGI